MSVPDPYPLMTMAYALDALKIQFGTDIVIGVHSQVTLKLHYPDRQDHTSVSLTVEQAKFLVANSLSAQDLLDQKYPANWPGGAHAQSTVPRPVQSGAVPVQFSSPKD